MKRLHEDLPKARSEREVRGARQQGVEAHDERVDHRFREERCHESTNGPLEVVEECLSVDSRSCFARAGGAAVARVGFRSLTLETTTKKYHSKYIKKGL